MSDLILQYYYATPQLNHRNVLNSSAFYQDADYNEPKITENQILLLICDANKKNQIAYMDKNNDLRIEDFNGDTTNEKEIKLFVQEKRGLSPSPKDPSDKDIFAEEDVEHKLLESYLNPGEAFSHNPCPTSQRAHINEKGPAVAEAHAKYAQIGLSPDKYIFYENIRKLDEKSAASKNDTERNKIGGLIDTLLDFDAKVQTNTPTQFNEETNLYSSVNNKLERALKSLPNKFVEAIQIAKSFVQNIIDSFTKETSQGDKTSLSDKPSCSFFSSPGPDNRHEKKPKENVPYKK